jgi:hypothetical protein
MRWQAVLWPGEALAGRSGRLQLPGLYGPAIALSIRCPKTLRRSRRRFGLLDEQLEVVADKGKNGQRVEAPKNPKRVELLTATVFLVEMKDLTT